MTDQKKVIIYTLVDEAPALATYSLLPIIKAITSHFDITFLEYDISLSGRIIAAFSDKLKPNQKQPDYLHLLKELTQSPYANIIKLPNISASVSQLNQAISELQQQGYTIPNYPKTAKNAADEQLIKKYKRILGSAVNPVIREGNSDRRVIHAVKSYAKQNPHYMGAWSKTSKTHISSMSNGDFFDHEISKTLTEDDILSIRFVDKKGQKTCLKSNITVSKGDIIDASFMSINALQTFLATELKKAKEENLLLSLHLKASMMKVSDPIIFGEAVKLYFQDIFNTFNDDLKTLNINPNDGFQAIVNAISQLSSQKQDAFEAALNTIYKNQAQLAMVNSDKGITNLHVPSDIIIDASMPALIKESGKMWGPDGKLHDTKALIPDRSYADIYQVIIDDCKAHGAFDPSHLGTFSNVGLMAQKAEEYGSHDKTFQAKDDGYFSVETNQGKQLFKQTVSKGDIWRMCLTRNVAIDDWISFAVKRYQLTNTPLVFWLDKNRAHDKELIKRVQSQLNALDFKKDYCILAPKKATELSVKRLRSGQNTISVTGNILRDYLTDLFPIIELGTSAKMLSVVPLLNGGALFETGAGGSAPKHVQQFQEEGHLRWDSLGEFLALLASLDHFAHIHKDSNARLLSQRLEKAVETWLLKKRAPSRKVNELDNRGSHLYLFLYWLEELQEYSNNPIFKETVTHLQSQLDTIINEINLTQAKAVELGGYYKPDPNLAKQAMCPSPTLNKILESLQATSKQLHSQNH